MCAFLCHCLHHSYLRRRNLSALFLNICFIIPTFGADIWVHSSLASRSSFLYSIQISGCAFSRYRLHHSSFHLWRLQSHSRLFLDYRSSFSQRHFGFGSLSSVSSVEKPQTGSDVIFARCSVDSWCGAADWSSADAAAHLRRVSISGVGDLLEGSLRINGECLQDSEYSLFNHVRSSSIWRGNLFSCTSFSWSILLKLGSRYLFLWSRCHGHYPTSLILPASVHQTSKQFISKVHPFCSLQPYKSC